jgi:hypothetical protein
MEYEGSIGLVMRKMKKKSDAQFGRVNTFIILHTMEEVFKIRNLSEQNSDFALFPILDPKARLRFEILFKKTHPRINLTTLILTMP